MKLINKLIQWWRSMRYGHVKIKCGCGHKEWIPTDQIRNWLGMPFCSQCMYEHIQGY